MTTVEITLPEPYLANSPQHWIPRSQIGYMRKDRLLAGTTVVFTLPEWLIEKKQCWELVP